MPSVMLGVIARMFLIVVKIEKIIDGDVFDRCGNIGDCYGDVFDCRGDAGDCCGD